MSVLSPTIQSGPFQFINASKLKRENEYGIIRDCMMLLSFVVVVAGILTE
jgi:hypothetical protein